MKTFGQTVRPRNPLVAAVMTRRGGGAHQKSVKAERQSAKRAIRGDLSLDATA